MIHAAKIIATVGILLSSAMQAAAQEPSDTLPAGTPEVVVISEKSSWAAGVLEWAIPTAGYAYAGNWSRGIPPAVVRITGAALWFSDLGIDPFAETSCKGACIVGVVLTAGGTIWGVADAVTTTKRENEKRRAAAVRGVGVVPEFGRGRRGVRVYVLADIEARTP
jgi:hypothetical protein